MFFKFNIYFRFTAAVVSDFLPSISFHVEGIIPYRLRFSRVFLLFEVTHNLLVSGRFRLVQVIYAYYISHLKWAVLYRCITTMRVSKTLKINLIKYHRRNTIISFLYRKYTYPVFYIYYLRRIRSCQIIIIIIGQVFYIISGGGYYIQRCSRTRGGHTRVRS